MEQNKRKRRSGWSSAVSWLIFLLVIAGGPIYNALRRALGSSVALPTNLVPLLIGGLVGLSILVAAVRALGNSSRVRGPQLPTDLSAPRRPPNAAMPPFGGAGAPQRPPIPAAPRAFTLPPGSAPTPNPPARQPAAPRFEPVINPIILGVGILGLLALGALGLIVLAGGLP